ncbi:MAG TPA: YggS family pyridoxal phosphate-dependent enzyme [Acidimicrobiia bacterium]|nr:YggS family pyridoxal phosphate-dependent enzyme [Acidimicrobiia bacterium]
MSLEAVKERIARAAERAGRNLDSVRLVVVSKGQTPSAIKRLYDRGQREFGENRAQELAAKVDQLPSDIIWHFVGPLQTNKVRLVRPIVTLLHSLDRADLIPAWVKGPGSPPAALIQVRIGGETQKHGVDPEGAMRLCEQAQAAGIEVAGVMTIPPVVDHPEEARPFFDQLVAVSEQLAKSMPQAREISMGMTDDFEVAIEAGATIVRIGRAIFAELPN